MRRVVLSIALALAPCALHAQLLGEPPQVSETVQRLASRALDAVGRMKAPVLDLLSEALVVCQLDGGAADLRRCTEAGDRFSIRYGAAGSDIDSAVYWLVTAVEKSWREQEIGRLYEKPPVPGIPRPRPPDINETLRRIADFKYLRGLLFGAARDRYGQLS